MIKVIFLDIDGVLTSVSSNWNLDKTCCENLKKIIEETDAKIVISSSWRLHTLNETLENLKQESKRIPFEFPCIDRIIGQTERIFSKTYTGKTVSSIRGLEINHWMVENPSTVSNYLILDDDCDMIYWQKDNFIKTDYQVGLTEDDVKKSIEILNSKK